MNQLARVLSLAGAVSALVSAVGASLSCGFGGGDECLSEELDIYTDDGCVIDVQETCSVGSPPLQFFQRCGEPQDGTSPAISLGTRQATTCDIMVTCKDGTIADLTVVWHESDGCTSTTASGPACSNVGACNPEQPFGNSPGEAHICPSSSTTGVTDGAADAVSVDSD